MTSTPQVGFESVIQVFERAKKVHVLDCAATVIGLSSILESLNNLRIKNRLKMSKFYTTFTDYLNTSFQLLRVHNVE
jgi:hypothetical protein